MEDSSLRKNLLMSRIKFIYAKLKSSKHIKYQKAKSKIKLLKNIQKRAASNFNNT